MARIQLTNRQLVDAIIDDLRTLADELEWKANQVGASSTSVAGATTTGSHTSDPTSRQATNPLAQHVARIRHQVRRDLIWLYRKKLPAMLGTLQLDDDRGRDSDRAQPSGGVSAYRGDTAVPAGRPDLHDALAAQRRRIERGESHGAA